MSYTAASRFANASNHNTCGPNDNFDPASPHALPALIRGFHDAKVKRCEEVVIWGTGAPRRESLRVDDLADACVFIMKRYDEGIDINAGAGGDPPVRELAETVKDVVHQGACLAFDSSKPDSTPRKLLDVSCLRALGWRQRITLHERIESTYDWSQQHGVLNAPSVG